MVNEEPTPSASGSLDEWPPEEAGDDRDAASRSMRERIDRARAREFLARMRTNAIAGPLPSAYLVWVLWGVVPTAQLLVWWLALLLWDSVSVVHSTLFLRRSETAKHPVVWVARQTITQCLAGLTWGLAMLWYNADVGVNNAILLVIVCAFALSSMNLLHYRLPAMVYTAAFWIVPTMVLLFEGGEYGRRLLLGVAVLAVSIVIYVADVTKQLSSGLEQRHQAEQLAIEVKKSAARIAHLAAYDDLCGCLNRRSGMEQLRLAGRLTETLSVVMVDADHFKTVNDRYGHPAGDSVLRELVRRLDDGLRASDVIARVGGEEFLIVMPDTTTEKAAQVAERLVRAVSAAPVEHEDIEIPVTISAGVATRFKTESVQDTLARADRALYSAKTNGRNRVEISPDQHPPSSPAPTTPHTDNPEHPKSRREGSKRFGAVDPWPKPPVTFLGASS